ncbi:MAG: hypothetical protein U0165_16510 [Polyangiaceae bacterium]
MTQAMGPLLPGIHTDPEQKVSLYEPDHRCLAWSQRASSEPFGAVVSDAAAGVLLLSRHIDPSRYPTRLAMGFDFTPMSFGLPEGQLRLPGNEACSIHHAVVGWFQPGLQALLWSVLPCSSPHQPRRASSITSLLHRSLLFAAVSTMASACGRRTRCCVLAYVVVTGRWAIWSRI